MKNICVFAGAAAGRGAEAPLAGVLVKMPKRGQEARADLPAIGPRTVAGAARARLAGIAIAAGATLVFDRDRTRAEADASGLFVHGFRL